MISIVEVRKYAIEEGAVHTNAKAETQEKIWTELF